MSGREPSSQRSADGVIDRGVERAAGSLLRWGTVASIVLVLGGLGRFLFQHLDRLGEPEFLSEIRSPDHPFPKSIGEIASGALALDGMACIMIGVTLLVATPILRVIVSGLAFLRLGDRAFAAFALAVLVLLAIAFVAGSLHGVA